MKLMPKIRTKFASAKIATEIIEKSGVKNGKIEKQKIIAPACRRSCILSQVPTGPSLIRFALFLRLRLERVMVIRVFKKRVAPARPPKIASRHRASITRGQHSVL